MIPHTGYVSSCLGEGMNVNKILLIVVLLTNDGHERDERQKHAIYLNEVDSVENNLNKGNSNQTRIRLSFADIRKIREGRNIILNNLEAELPSLKDFAHQLGTNEFKLKYGFRELYGTSVYRFLLQERLRKAKMLIQRADTV